MRKILLLLLLLLIACRPEAAPEMKTPEPTAAPAAITPVPEQKLSAEPATRTVKQEGSLGTVVYGLTEDNRIVRVEKTGAVWEYHYENGKLAEISGPKDIRFLYVRGKLDTIDLGPTSLQFKYDSRDRLVEVKGAQETLHMDYDSLDQIRAVKRGIAGETSIDYDKKGKIKYLTRGPITTNVYFDDKDRIREFEAEATKMILGYWRDDKLISLTGESFGPGVAVSYGPDYPPFEADVISADDNSKFTAAYTDTLYKVTDEYIYCKYVRRLKDVVFEGLSYAFYVNYFKGDIVNYLAMQYMCLPYEA